MELNQLKQEMKQQQEAAAKKIKELEAIAPQPSSLAEDLQIQEKQPIATKASDEELAFCQQQYENKQKEYENQCQISGDLKKENDTLNERLNDERDKRTLAESVNMDDIEKIRKLESALLAEQQKAFDHEQDYQDLVYALKNHTYNNGCNC